MLISGAKRIAFSGWESGKVYGEGSYSAAQNMSLHRKVKEFLSKFNRTCGYDITFCCAEY